MAAKAGDDNNGSRKWKPCARKRGESGGESTLGLEHRRNQVFDAAQLSLQDIHNTETNTCENVSHGGSKKMMSNPGMSCWMTVVFYWVWASTETVMIL